MRGVTEVAVRDVSFDELSIGTLDLVRAVRVGELDAFVLDRAGPGEDGTDCVIDDGGGNRSLDDAMLLAAAIGELLAGARAAMPDDTGDATDLDAAALAELSARASSNVLDDALAALSTDPARGLRAAAALGVAGAVPALSREYWPAQVRRATDALIARKARLSTLDSSTYEGARDRLRALLGDDLVIAPVLPALKAEIADGLADQASLIGPDPTVPLTWLARAAAVRPAVAPLDRVVLLADAIAPTDVSAGVRVMQEPHVAGAEWIGRDALTTTPRAGTRSTVVHAPLPIGSGAAVAGLYLDGWNEAIPTANQVTALTFQVDQPSAAPPQAILLAVPGDAAPTGTPDRGVGCGRAALLLAQLRLVDGDALGGAEHYLPATYFAINLAGDTASTDFTGGE
jgi:hypothetical protein